jgi:hypothetical protein
MSGSHRKSERGTGARWSMLALLGLLLLAAILVRVQVGGSKDGRGSSPAGARAASPPAASEPVAPSAASPSPPTPRGRLIIHATGDVNVDPGYIPNFATYGYGYAWSGLGGLFKRDDLTVVNLECAVSNLGSAVPKQFNFRGDPAALPAMKAAGIEVANMGNNHSYDYGPTALLDTRQNLIQAGIAPVGAGANPAQAVAPAMFDVEGWKVAVVGFDKVVDPYP